MITAARSFVNPYRPDPRRSVSVVAARSSAAHLRVGSHGGAPSVSATSAEMSAAEMRSAAVRSNGRTASVPTQADVRRAAGPAAEMWCVTVTCDTVMSTEPCVAMVPAEMRRARFAEMGATMVITGVTDARVTGTVAELPMSKAMAADVRMGHAASSGLASDDRSDRTVRASGHAGVAVSALMPQMAISAVRAPDVLPMTEPPIPGAPLVVAVPVGSQREGYDRHVNLFDVARQMHVAPTIEVIEVICADPATIIAPCHVAPIMVAQASMDIETRIVGDGRDDRIIRTGPGPHVHACRGVSSSCQRRRRRGKYEDGCGKKLPSIKHRVPPD